MRRKLYWNLFAIFFVICAVAIMCESADAVNCDYNSCIVRYGKAGYCTDYIKTVKGINISGHAKDWYSNANYKKGKTPQPNSIAVFSATKSNPYGHVAWVEEVVVNRFRVTHWNWGKIDNSDAYAVCCAKTDHYGEHNRDHEWFSTSDNVIGFIYVNSHGNVTPPRTPKYEIRISNIDDEGGCYVNDHKVASVGYYQDTGWVDVTSRLHTGDNEIKFKVKNNREGYAYHFQFRENGKMVKEWKCGEVGRKGCDKPLKKGNVLTKKIEYRL